MGKIVSRFRHRNKQRATRSEKPPSEVKETVKVASRDELSQPQPSTSNYVPPSEGVANSRKKFKVRRKDEGKTIEVTASSFEELQRKCAEMFKFGNVTVTWDGQDFLAGDFASVPDDTLLHVLLKIDVPVAPEGQHQATESAPPPERPEITSEDIIEIAKKLHHHYLRPLGVKLGFNSAQIENYELDTKFNVPYVYITFIKMLEEWKRKEIRTRTELEDIIESVKACQCDGTIYQPPVHPDDLDVAQFRKELKQYYLCKYCRIKRDPWENKDFKLERYFTTLSLLEIKKGEYFGRKIPLQNSHNDIFSLEVEGNKPARLLVRGEGGTGKSTLCKKLVYDWAQQEPKSPLKDIPLVCVIEFRRLKENDNIEDAICSQLLSRSSKIRPEQIKAYMEQRPLDIILIFDGLDEFKSTEYLGDITDILRWESLRDVRILVTTRPWHSLSLQNNATYTQLDLEGFNKTGVKSYVQIYFPNEAEQYMKQIEANKAICLLAGTPVLLAMICYVLQRFPNISDIKTLGQLFDHFLRALFFNKVYGASISGARYTDQTPDKSLEMQKLKQFWNDLGEIALPALLKPGKKLLFSNTDFTDRKGILDTGLIIGLLVRHESELSDDALEVREVYYSFPHLLFQEKCAGDCMKKCDQATLRSYLEKIKTEDAALNLQYMLLFTSGKEWNRETTESIINHLVTLYDTSDDSDIDEPHVDEISEDVNIKPIATKLSQGVSFMTEDLFGLGLLINYDSQMEGRLSRSLAKLFENNTIILDERFWEYPAKLYFLEFTKGITTISGVIFDHCNVSFDQVVRLSGNCSCRHLTIKQSFLRIIHLENTTYTAENRSMSNLRAVILDRISTPIPLYDVLALTITLCPVLTDLTIKACRVDIKPYTELETTSKTCRAITPSNLTVLHSAEYKSVPKMKTIRLYCISNPIPLYDLLALTSTLCPVLTDLYMGKCRVDIKSYAELKKMSKTYRIINPEKITDTVRGNGIPSLTDITVKVLDTHEILALTTACPFPKDLYIFEAITNRGTIYFGRQTQFRENRV